VRARDLAEDFPVVHLGTDALTAVLTMGRERRPGIIVCEDDGTPHTVLPGSQVLRFLVPRYVQDDPTLARVYDELTSDETWRKLARKTVHDLLPEPQDRDDLPVVEPDATTVEVAALMARLHSPVVAVVEEGRVLGAITVSRLFEVMFPDDGVPDDLRGGEDAPR
jgi:hypothetical protein